MLSSKRHFLRAKIQNRKSKKTWKRFRTVKIIMTSYYPLVFVPRLTGRWHIWWAMGEPYPSPNKNNAITKTKNFVLLLLEKMDTEKWTSHGPIPRSKWWAVRNHSDPRVATKDARIFFLGHYLFRRVNSFRKAKLVDNYSLLEIDNVQGHYFLVHCLYRRCEQAQWPSFWGAFRSIFVMDV